MSGKAAGIVLTEKQHEKAKGSATVLKEVNDRFEKRFSNSIFCDSVFV